jgi:endoglucanase
LSAAVSDETSGDKIRYADFSSVRQSGDYYLEVEGAGRSWDFAIAPDVYNRVYYLAARGFYGQRCGTAVNMAPDFPQYKHDICHIAGRYDPSAGKEGNHASAKGWHDAGDYGRYVVNSGISTGTLLWTWELYGTRIGKISLHIPESGSPAPDLLSEIRWNLDWMLSMQDADGGVFHKQTSAAFCGFIQPERDKLPSLVIGTGKEPFKSSCATADLTAVTAIAARAFRGIDNAYAQRNLEAATKAWSWLEENPNVTFRNPAGITTGEYGDHDCSDEHLWAAAELWRTTRKPEYEQYFLSHYAPFLPHVASESPQNWSQVSALGLWTYVLGGGTNAAAVKAIRDASIGAADQIVRRTAATGYLMSLTARDYVWGSNGVAANYGMQLLIANQLRPDPQYIQTALDNIHYLLGRNTFSLSWVTHIGEHSFQHPHHRPSGSADEGPWPGLLSGGPNPGRQDSVMKRVVPADVKPARAYVDLTGAYACNEVAINWNAPLVFVLAAAVRPHTQ